MPGTCCYSAYLCRRSGRLGGVGEEEKEERERKGRERQTNLKQRLEKERKEKEAEIRRQKEAIRETVIEKLCSRDLLSSTPTTAQTVSTAAFLPTSSHPPLKSLTFHPCRPDWRSPTRRPSMMGAGYLGRHLSLTYLDAVGHKYHQPHGPVLPPPPSARLLICPTELKVSCHHLFAHCPSSLGLRQVRPTRKLLQTGPILKQQSPIPHQHPSGKGVTRGMGPHWSTCMGPHHDHHPGAAGAAPMG